MVCRLRVWDPRFGRPSLVSAVGGLGVSGCEVVGSVVLCAVVVLEEPSRARCDPSLGLVLCLAYSVA